jgi:RNA polymerase sigma factor (sigma-70 family)
MTTRLTREQEQAALARGDYDAIMRDHAGCVLAKAQAYARRTSIDVEDLVAVGNMGLVRALRSFDSTRGTRFWTFAEYWVQSFMRVYLSKEIADDQAFVRIGPCGDGGAVDDTPDPEAILIQKEDNERTVRALSVLTRRERIVIEARMGFDRGGEQTLEQVGQILGVTRERVRQIEVCALAKMRAYLGGLGDV